jgi:hydrogenase maturation protease
MKKSLILGLGNPLRGDDGIGSAVIASLRDQNLPPQVVALDGGTPGLEMILTWQGYERVIIVDAAELGGTPGTWKRLLREDFHLGLDAGVMQGTMHDAGLAEAMALAEALDILPPELILFCVQPAYTGWSPNLSDPVRSCICPLCKAIYAEAVA